MRWLCGEPRYGDILRVKLRFYCHYGIYADNDHVYAFGLPDNSGVESDAISVVCTDVSTFSGGGIVEHACLSIPEKLKRRSPKETIEYAKSKLGTCGYNILHNNCEHFVNECVFRNPQSHTVKSFRDEVRKKLE